MDVHPFATQCQYLQTHIQNKHQNNKKKDLNAFSLLTGGGLESGQESTMTASRGLSKGFDRIAKCRNALEALDASGWNRSFHQRLFHDQFIRASARVFWKNEKPGVFQREHKDILEMNGWDNLSQEILVSTPRRFGKTISVSMFAAAMLYAAPNIEISIYSTCKRISQKLLRNVQKFLGLIFEALNEKSYDVVRSNMEEYAIHGCEGPHDRRVVNSYPSKVTSPFTNTHEHLSRNSLPPSYSKQEIVFVNDSKATSFDATQHALKNYKNIFWK